MNMALTVDELQERLNFFVEAHLKETAVPSTAVVIQDIGSCTEGDSTA